MATTSIPPPPLKHSDQREIRIYQHSHLFYWWPVWLFGFVMALWTYVDGHRMAIVPPNTTVAKAGTTYVLETHGGDTAKLDEAANRPDHHFPVHVSQNSSLGAFFVIVLLLVITITNAPLRGLWSVIVIV